MKVTISVKGRFHAFNLAKELQNKSHLERLITSYPVFEVPKYGIDRHKILSLPTHEVIERVWRKLPSKLSDIGDARHLFCELYDRHVARKLSEGSDIFVGWSSFSLHSIRRAKQLGSITVLERGSSHIAHQRDILLEEYRRYGSRGETPHPQIVEKEIQEYEETDFISVPSRYVKQSFLESGIPEKKIIHVPYGVDLANFYPVPKQDSIFRVIHCGTLSLRKGVHYLMQAFSELNLPRSELWLIGSMTEEIRPLYAQFFSEKIMHKGPFPQKELYRFYSQGSVFALASIEEGLAMVQAQAMACGLPVVCTTNTGGEDIVRNGIDGFIVPIRDVGALKEKILYLYENPAICAAMGKSARERVRSGFTWSDYGENMIMHYKRLCTRHKESSFPQA